MYCGQCGKKITDDADFCPECGASQKSTVQTYQNEQTKTFSGEKMPIYEKWWFLAIAATLLIAIIGSINGVLLVVIGILGFCVCLVIFIVFAIRKKSIKTIGVLLAAFFVSFFVGAILTSNMKTTNEKSNPYIDNSKVAKSDVFATPDPEETLKELLSECIAENLLKPEGLSLDIDTGTATIQFERHDDLADFTDEMYCGLIGGEVVTEFINYRPNQSKKVTKYIFEFYYGGEKVFDGTSNSDGSEVTISKNGQTVATDTATNFQNAWSEEVAIEEANAEKAVLDEYKNKCTSFDYQTVARDPDKYLGQYAKFTGEVIQVQESGSLVVLRVNVTNNSNYYTDTIYVEYFRKSDSESRILENDIVNLYGTMGGLETYTTVLGASVSIPLLYAEYIDLT